MPIVLRILEKHGFELSIEDPVELGGARFVVTGPRGTEAIQSAESANAPVSESQLGA